MKAHPSYFLLFLAVFFFSCNSQPSENKKVATIEKSEPVQTIQEDTIPEKATATIIPESEKSVVNKPKPKSKKRKLKKPEPAPSRTEITSTTLAAAPVTFTAPEPEAALTVADIYKHFEKAQQTFTISVTKDTTIICKEGTSIYIPANAFVSEKTGKLVTGAVQISVKEFYQFSDMLLANLSTTSGSEILETGGMLHITATAGNEKCIIKRNQTIDIGFPYDKPKPDMQLFLGDWAENKVDWKLADQPEANGASRNYRIGNSFRGRQRKERPDRNLAFIGGEKAMQKHLNKYAKYPLSALKKRTEGTVIVVAIIDHNGHIDEVKVKKGVTRALDRAAVYAVRSMRRNWRPARSDGHTRYSRTTIPVTFRLPDTEPDAKMLQEARSYAWRIRRTNLRYGDFPKSDRSFVTNDKQYKAEFEKRYSNTDLNELTANELNQYLFSTTQLGWINCDRFYQTDQPKIDYVIKPAKPENLEVKVIFHSARSILPGISHLSRYTVSKVPLDEKITIVAFKTENNQIQLAVKETTIQKSGEKDLVFEPVTMAKLKEEMQKLNRIN